MTPRVAIVNGKVIEKPDVATAVLRLASLEGGARVRVTGGTGDARRFAREAGREGIESIAIFGGDGTLNEVVSGLVSDLDDSFEGELAVIPAGTANDYAAGAGIPLDSPIRAVEALADSRPLPLDVGRVTGDATAFFINVATAGFGVEASSSASEELKAVLGRVSYVVSGLASPGETEPRRARISAPGIDREVSFHLLAIGNGRYAGGGMALCPEADPTDGQFDVTIVPEGTVGETLAEVVRNGLRGIGDAGIRFRAPWVEVRAEEPLQVNLDGEPASGTELRFEVIPGAVRVLLPNDSPILAGPSSR